MQPPADLPVLEAAGVRPLALSCDRRADVAAFAAARDITPPLLADAGNVVIRRLGLPNTAIPPQHPRSGVTRPATYLLDHDGRVERAILRASRTVRDSRPTALHRMVALRADAQGRAHGTRPRRVAIAESLDSATRAPRAEPTTVAAHGRSSVRHAGHQGHRHVRAARSRSAPGGVCRRASGRVRPDPDQFPRATPAWRRCSVATRPDPIIPRAGPAGAGRGARPAARLPTPDVVTVSVSR